MTSGHGVRENVAGQSSLSVFGLDNSHGHGQETSDNIQFTRYHCNEYNEWSTTYNE